MSIKRLGCAMILFLSILFILPLTAAANGYHSYQVAPNRLNVREAPAIESKAMGYLDKGTRVTSGEMRYGWAKVTYNGKPGWVASQYLLAISSESERVSGQVVTVKVNGVNIRSGAGLDHAVMTQANRGDRFSLIENRQGWAHVRLNNGRAGWIADSLVTSAPSVAVHKDLHSLKGYHIVIDPGHGGIDPGAIGIQGVKEKMLTLETANHVADALRKAGATVVMTRTSDRFIPLAGRVAISQGSEADAFISIHFNSSSSKQVHGVSTFYYSGGKDKVLASDIQTQLIDTVPLQNNGIKFGDFHVLRENPDLAVLIELGFVTNPSDLSLIQTPSFQSDAAKAITKGLLDYFKEN
ncbi:N-acetylmuramoyl-L-alanine amidase [Camelliibacillus cellulosilyticus]|uniref:N-acetylmuramoyl-L-alanine amidase n=1 Tax=Camelliibacillus cellulosilyticus TaxID=2174486 RepID=A0ABV9GRX9_9BACL